MPKRKSDYVESNNELNDASKDRDIASNTERDTERHRSFEQATTDVSQDVDSQEHLRTNSVNYAKAKLDAEVENQRRDRALYDRAQTQALDLQAQLNASYASAFAQMLQNMVSDAEKNKIQERRHVDHTLVDLHGDD